VFPHGSALVNAPFFESSIAAVNGAVSCAQITAASTDAVASLQAEIATVTSQLALLGPLVVVPTNLPEVITWITNFIAPMVITQTNATAQIALLNAKLAALTAAIASKQSELGCP
jgi:hypothetical protein